MDQSIDNTRNFCIIATSTRQDHAFRPHLELTKTVEMRLMRERPWTRWIWSASAASHQMPSGRHALHGARRADLSLYLIDTPGHVDFS